MATMKTVQVEATLQEKFKIETRIRNHVAYIDQPVAGGGTDAGPTPLEYFLMSLAGCLASVARIIAHQKKIQLRALSLSVEGDLDLDVLVGKNQVNRPGFRDIKVKVKLDADLSPAEKVAFLEEVERRCPVSDNIAKGTPVSVRLE